jgi:hypothetical protein
MSRRALSVMISTLEVLLEYAVTFSFWIFEVGTLSTRNLIHSFFFNEYTFNQKNSNPSLILYRKRNLETYLSPKSFCTLHSFRKSKYLLYSEDIAGTIIFLPPPFVEKTRVMGLSQRDGFIPTPLCDRLNFVSIFRFY